jgi:RNA polymerase sigma factor (sigma-70 family)
MSNHDSADAPARFPTTAWSRIRVVQDRKHPAHVPAVNGFIALYWKPVFYFLRAKGIPFHDAQDRTQEFFLRLMEQNVVSNADPQRGRFRSFLLGVLKRFLIDWGPRATAQIRHERQFVSIENLIGDEERTYEPAVGEDAETVFEQRWAGGVWERVLQQLRERYTGERSSWPVLFMAYTAPEGKRPSQEALAEQFQLSRDQVRDVLAKVGQRFESLLRAEIREEVGSEQDIDDEIA